MALVYDNQVEEVGGKQFAEMLLVIVTHQLLIQGEVHLMRGNGAFIVFRHIDFMSHFFQRGKILLDRLIHQNITVSKIKDFSFHTALQHPIDDLEGSIGLAGASGHNQQNPLLSPCNGVHGTVDGITLIISGRVGVLAGIVGLLQYGLLLRRQAGFLLIPGDQFLLCGELIQTKFPLLSGQKIMFHKPIPVGAVRKRHIQHFGIGHGLLQAVRNAVGVIFGFHNGNGIIYAEVEDIVRPFWLFTEYKIAFQVDLSVCNPGFHGDFLPAPLGSDGRGNILKFNIFFAHLMLG